MLSLAEVVRQHGPAYVSQYGAQMLPSHSRALRDIASCRTSQLGGHLAMCAACGEQHLVYHSCRSRACPRCGHRRAEQWVQRHAEHLLPVRYFHVVFTLPTELRRLVRDHQRALIPVLFRAAYDALASLCRDRRHLGGSIGALGVLHTWSRSLEWHPHVHFLVPGGTLSLTGQWLAAKRVRGKRVARYLVPVRALSAGFRGRFLRMARRALTESSLPDVPDKPWVVYAKPALYGAKQVLANLGRYVHRTALAESQLVRCNERSVALRYLDHRDRQRKTMTLPVAEFLRRYLQHGLHRVRAFGLLHREKRATLQRLQLLLGAPQVAEVGGKSARGVSRLRRNCHHAQRTSIAPPLRSFRASPPRRAAPARPAAQCGRAKQHLKLRRFLADSRRQLCLRLLLTLFAAIRSYTPDQRPGGPRPPPARELGHSPPTAIATAPRRSAQKSKHQPPPSG